MTTREYHDNTRHNYIRGKINPILSLANIQTDHNMRDHKVRCVPTVPVENDNTSLLQLQTTHNVLTISNTDICYLRTSFTSVVTVDKTMLQVYQCSSYSYSVELTVDNTISGILQTVYNLDNTRALDM